ncbi:MAG: helix-turn-helix transcriptional regulator [Coriobacteriaceae bacterium]|jgi:DNA-binding CsgD family transcriptional regulator|nr:helix-turn-helix transcriptional regulator [Coriobacteriaceae bacterium]
MIVSITRLFAPPYRRLLGFPLFIAWHFCTFYSCVLIENLSLVKSSERYWAVALGATALVSVLFIVSTRLRAWLDSGFVLRYAGAGAAMAGTAVLNHAFLSPDISLAAIFLGGALAGSGLGVMIAAWFSVLSEYDPALIELWVPGSFLAAIAIYLPVVYCKNLACIMVVMLLPLASMVLANLPRRDFRKQSFAEDAPGTCADVITCGTDAQKHLGSPHSPGCPGILSSSSLSSPGSPGCLGRPDSPGKKPGHEGLWAEGMPALERWEEGGKGNTQSLFPRLDKEPGLMGTAAIFAVLWFCFALFRTFAVPDYPSNRYTHYLLAFGAGLLIVVAIAAMAVRFARSLGLTTALRISAPLVCLSFALIGVLNGPAREIAYAANFSAVVLMQLFLWIGLSKSAHFKKTAADIKIYVLLIAIGAGACLGVGTGFLIQRNPPESPLFALLPFVATLLVASIMVFWRQAERTADPVYEPDEKEDGAWASAAGEDAARKDRGISPQDMGRILDEILQTKALILADAYSLTSREMEVLVYILAGRSRPFIRDRLNLSLNTVNTYIKRIYLKTEVHSQQELLDKAQLECPR